MFSEEEDIALLFSKGKQQRKKEYLNTMLIISHRNYF